MKRVIDHSGCKSCPAYPKCTVAYRGSACAALRDTYGLGDPMTNAEKIRAMSDEELAKWLSICGCPDAFSSVLECEEGKCEECWMVYLKQPYKEDA